MPPRKEIWDELTRLRGQAEPDKAHPPRPNDPDRTRKIILKTAAITSIITAFVISASVINAFTFINSSRNQNNAWPTHIPDKFSLNTISEYFLAYQKNIPEGYHVVLAIDVERLRLCWPKKPFIHPNRAFRI